MILGASHRSMVALKQPGQTRLKAGGARARGLIFLTVRDYLASLGKISATQTPPGAEGHAG